MTDALYRQLIAFSKEEIADLDRDEVDTAIEQGLASSHNRSIYFAAQLARRTDAERYTSQLLAAYERLLKNPVKSDPGCESKTEAIEALASAGHDDETFFLAAVKYRQLEPVRGGEVDTAAKLRVIAAYRLTELNGLRAIGPLVELLVDSEKTARAGAARALATCGEDHGKHLLRLKLEFGDAEPEVIGEVAVAYLAIARDEGIGHVAKYLRSESIGLRMEAALALGESRLAGALEPLRRHMLRIDEREEARMTLTAIALQQSDESTQYLLEQLHPESQSVFKREAIHALSHVRDRKNIKTQLTEILSKIDDRGLQQAFDESFE